MDQFEDIHENEERQGEAVEQHIPRPKRIACVLCRRRKLKCDGARPSCGTCSRLAHDCAYDEVRKKSGPKRGYVKQLEARLAQVETLLKSQDGVEKEDDTVQSTSDSSKSVPLVTTTQLPNSGNDSIPISLPEISPDADMLDPQMGFMGDQMFDFNSTTDFSWEMISLGVEEPLPDPEVIDDLHEIYFAKINPIVPILHRPRYYASLNLSPHMKPPICLRYAVWLMAATTTPKYESVVEHFYQRARKYIQMDEMKGLGEAMCTLAHCQTWVLIGTYEFKYMNFPRAWHSVGRASRAAFMMGLQRVDGGHLDVKQVLPPPRDWIDREERRRTFWACFCHDRYASAGTGWPMAMDEKDIQTLLPVSAHAFEFGRQESAMTLQEAMRTRRDGNLSSYAAVCIMAALYGRNLHHLHRPTAEDDEQDMNGQFWNRHRMLDNIHLTTSLALPPPLKLPQGLSDPNAIFCNMSLHTSAICLHQAAIFKAEKYNLPHIGEDSKRRCLLAAEQVSSIMKMMSHMDLSSMNPYVCYSVYIAARVFLQYLKTNPNDGQSKSTLQFLVHALSALKIAAPLAESFSMQLDVEIQVEGLTDIKPPQSAKMYNHVALGQMDMHDTVHCSPLFDIRESQNPTAKPGATGLFLRPEFQSSASGNVQTTVSAQSGFQGFPAPVMRNAEHLNVEQDIGKSPSDSHNGESHPQSDHTTPSTLSHRESSNTSYSPSVPTRDNNSKTQSFTAMQYPPLTYNLAKETNKPPLPSYGSNGSWEAGLFDGNLISKDNEATSWMPEIGDSQFQPSIEEIAWQQWNSTGQSSGS